MARTYERKYSRTRNLAVARQEAWPRMMRVEDGEGPKVCWVKTLCKADDCTKKVFKVEGALPNSKLSMSLRSNEK